MSAANRHPAAYQVAEDELSEADDFADWVWWREQQEDRPDPWGDPAPPPRQYPPMPTEPPF